MVRRGIAAMLIGNGVFAATQFAMLMALARLTGPETVGNYGLALAIAAPPYFLANLKLRQVAVSDTAGEYSVGHYVSTRLAAVGVVWLILAAVSFWTPQSELLLAVSSLKALDLASDIFYSLPHRTSHFTGISVSLSVRGALGATVFVSSLWQASSIEAAAWSAVAVYSIAVACDFQLARRFGNPRPIWEWATTKSLLQLTAPLGVALAVSSLSSMLPRYVLQLTNGAYEVGIYTALAYLLILGGLVINSVGQAVSPYLARQLTIGDLAQFRTTVRRLRLFGSTLGLTGAAATLFAGKPLLRVAFGPEYAARSDVLLILMAAAAITYASVFIGTALNAMRRFDAPLPITALSTIIGAALLAPAAYRWGLEGAAVVASVRAAVELLLYEQALRKEYGILSLRRVARES